MSAALKAVSHDFTLARFNMVESQLRPNGVRDDRVLDVMQALPRELFVSDLMAGIAYIDEDLLVAPHRYLLKPMVLARLLQAAHIKPTDKVLDIGLATGYSTALISGLAQHVVAIESDPVLGQQAANNLSSLKLTNIDLQHGAMTDGCTAKAPFDVIMLNGSVEVVPEALLNQLAEGGRLIAVVLHYGPAHAAHTGEARLYEKIRGMISHRPLFDASAKPLPGFEAIQKFTF